MKEREPSDTIRIYNTDKDRLKSLVAKRIKAWEKKKEGPKPWIADIIKDLMASR